MKKKAVFLDIDGTLIGRDHSVTRKDKKAMEEAAKRGHFLFLNVAENIDWASEDYFREGTSAKKMLAFSLRDAREVNRFTTRSRAAG